MEPLIQSSLCFCCSVLLDSKNITMCAAINGQTVGDLVYIFQNLPFGTFETSLLYKNVCLDNIRAYE